MRRTLLLCFIHGFKGGDETFRTFPSHVKALLQHALPKVTVLTITYPQFETRGDLHECVGRFKEWLQNKVIDLEVANSTPSPTVDPSVRTILVGHSMGVSSRPRHFSLFLPTNPFTHSQIRKQSRNPQAHCRTTRRSIFRTYRASWPLTHHTWVSRQA